MKSYKDLFSEQARRIKTLEGDIYTNIPTDQGVTPEQQISQAEVKSKASSKSRGGPKKVEVTRSKMDPFKGMDPNKPIVNVTGEKGSGSRTKSISPAQARGLGLKSGREKDVLDAADDAMRAGSNTPGRGSSGRSGQSILDDLLGKPPASNIRKGPSAVKQSEVSKNIKASLRQKGFGNVTGVDAQGYPTYAPPKDVPKGETGRRAQRTSNPRTYSSVKAEIEAAKGFKGVKSGGLETRNVPEPVKRYRETRAIRRGIPDPFTSRGSFSQTEFEKSLRKTVKKQVKATGTRPTPTAPDPFKGATSIPKTTPKSQGAPDRTATKQAVKDLKASQQRLNIGTETGGKVSTRTTTSVPTKKNALALRQDSPMHRGAYDAAVRDSKTPKVKISTTYTPPKIDKGPSIDVSQPTKPKSFKQFTSQAGSVKTRKDAWSYKPQKATTLDPKEVSSAGIDKRVRSVTKMKETNPASYAREVQRRASNISNIRTRKSSSGLGILSAPLAGYDAYQEYQKARKEGQSKEYSTKSAIATAGGGFVGAEAGAKLGAKLGSKLGAKGALVGGLVGGALGYAGGSKLGKAALGTSQKDKDWMKWVNRAKQAGTSADSATFKSGNKAIVRDTSGKERVGYLAYKKGKPVYKYGNEPSSLRLTSSNPLERIGRTIAQSNLGPVSDFVKSQYAKSDEATRKKKVAAVKAAASK